MNIPDTPETLTTQDIEAAKARLIEPYIDFPFVDEASRDNVIGLLLALIAKPLIDGCVPMLIIDKPQAGTGATLCVDVTALIATGRTASLDSMPGDDDEMRKLISTKLINGNTLMVLDNLEGLLRSTALSILLTAIKWHARILGSLNEIDLDNNLIVIGTGNNVTTAGDLHRRCYFGYMDAQEARPWMSAKQYRHANLIQWVKDNRGPLLAAGITLIKAWLQAGSPPPKNVAKIGRFEGFRDIIGGIMEYAGFSHFLGNLIETYEKSDVEIPQWEHFLEAWHGLLGDQGITVAELIRKLNDNQEFKSTLPDSLNELETKNASRVIGNRIAKRDNNRFPNGLMLKKDGTHNRAVKWAVMRYKNVTHNQSDSQMSLMSLETPITRNENIKNCLNIDGCSNNSDNSYPDLKPYELSKATSLTDTTELPDCPKCGQNDWHYDENGRLVCCCGYMEVS